MGRVSERISSRHPHPRGVSGQSYHVLVLAPGHLFMLADWVGAPSLSPPAKAHPSPPRRSRIKCMHCMGKIAQKGTWRQWRLGNAWLAAPVQSNSNFLCPMPKKLGMKFVPVPSQHP